MLEGHQGKNKKVTECSMVQKLRFMVARKKMKSKAARLERRAHLSQKARVG